MSKDSHSAASFEAMLYFDDALLSIKACANILRSNRIDQSEEAMKCERALTKAIELLEASGFRAPPRT
jgi:hypothetical protein